MKQLTLKEARELALNVSSDNEKKELEEWDALSDEAYWMEEVRCLHCPYGKKKHKRMYVFLGDGRAVHVTKNGVGIVGRLRKKKGR